MPSLTRATLFGATVLTACGGPLITERKDEQGLTALMRAARAPDTVLVAQLLETGADVNARDRDGLTAFMHTRSSEIRRVLIASGATPTLPSERSTVRGLLARFR